ncbi:efflux RND transporter permease subunit [Enterobacter chuandaensis]|uniref:efflux RND transporter permease subunit n=1 Tax=Enterobacter chuandaensis TaxID=2497875 RepID=UPI00281121DE|nr:efflux RND transporter permease subunit [Enterobacter chuandaensis]
MRTTSPVIQDQTSRINGVRDIDAYGSQYSMRVRQVNKLNSFQIDGDNQMPSKLQNAQNCRGALGGTPFRRPNKLNATDNSQSLLQTPDQFRNITLRVNQDGSGSASGRCHHGGNGR